MRNLLRDVFPEAVSLVSKGANRKRFFMRKEAEERVDELIELPGGNRLVKTSDWSAVYCVVAEPGAEEDPGLGAPDQAIPDIWASEDEIRKAAHRFMESGALVNAMHRSLEPWGTVVENYVAPADFDVDGDTIKKGSWVVAIRPTDAGREAIEVGEFAGVSIEGLGIRELEKGAFDEAKHPRDLEGQWIKVALSASELGQLGDALSDIGDPYGEGSTELGNRVQSAYNKAQAADKRVLMRLTQDHFGEALDALSDARDFENGPATPLENKLIDARQDLTVGRGPIGKAATTGYLCSSCGHFMPAETARDRAACPSCRHRFRNAPMGYLSKAAGLAVAIVKDALLVPNKPGVTNWIERAGGLPKYIADVAGDLISKGKTTSQAIQLAIGIVRNWSRGQGHVSAKTRAKATAAVAEYEAKRAKAHLMKGEGEATGELAAEAERLAEDPELIAKADARASAANGASLKPMKDFFRKLGERVGMSADELAELDALDANLAKADTATFAEIMAQRELEDELPDAFSVLRDAVWNAFYPKPDETRDPATLIAQSLDEFKVWALDKVDGAASASVKKLADQLADDPEIRTSAEAIAEAAGEDVPEKLAKFVAIASAGVPANFGEEMGLTAEEREQVEGLETRLTGLEKSLIGTDEEPGMVAKIHTAVEGLAAKPEETTTDEDEPKPADLQKAVDELQEDVKERFEKLGADLKKLGDGDTSQTEGDPPPEDEAAARAERVLKAHEDRKLNHDLAGIL